MKKILFQCTTRVRSRSGITLIEMLIYSALFSILVVVLSEILLSTLEVRIESQANAAVNQDSRFLLSRLSYDIQRSSAITVPNALGGSGGVLTLTIGGANTTYQLAGNAVTITNTNGTDALSSPESSMSALTFKRLGNVGGKESVQVKFTVTSVARKDSGAESRSFQTTIGRR
jgi:competence protein ComGC